MGSTYNSFLYNTSLYNSVAVVPPPIPPDPGDPVPVREIYNRVAWDLLEDYQLRLGVLTDQEFLDYLEEAILEFCQQTGMVKKIFTQTISAGQSQYIIPDDLLQVQNCFVGGVYINQTNLDELHNAGNPAWATESGMPQQWFEDGLPASRAQLYPIPDYTGDPILAPQPPFGDYGSFHPEQGNFTCVGGSGPNPIALTLDDFIPSVIPNSFTPYLVYRIEWRVFSQDGETKDIQRAIYCNSRWQEGLALGASIMMEAMAENAKK